MQHLPPEALALCALGEAGPQDTAHLDNCAECTAEVTALQRVVTAGRTTSVPEGLPRPPSSVWDSIHARLGLGDAVRADPFDADPLAQAPSNEAAQASSSPDKNAETGSAPSPATLQSPPTGSTPVPLEAARKRRERRRLPQVLGAAAAAVVLAAAGTWGVSRILADRSEVIAAVELAPLPAYSETGRAEVDQRSDGGRELVVTASGSDAQGFREVWLIAPDVQRMVSLGTMEGTEGRFTIPANLDLDEYPIVDISDEPFDGNPTHSGDSILRGVLEL
ncbi:anti-sigma factor [Arthrobacter sp. zg-Y1171]|uniref:anti-sigma factor n=1 Tax=Arthrobacter sp. zg-Y1171 TaxID=2964610 RepID=UPI002104822A|nr:anti-sigma factor [Arthrobacter sp. zg-Y1171]MCQ1995217.1 anti-sigma factor [Arthrobacter sp. zg-Y1171]UWX80740.1 anti-sigma factor [Arthrobacter sp. zg-Y1171]